MWTPCHMPRAFETETGGAKAQESWPSHVSYELERLVPSNLLAMPCGRRPRGGL